MIWDSKNIPLKTSPMPRKKEKVRVRCVFVFTQKTKRKITFVACVDCKVWEFFWYIFDRKAITSPLLASQRGSCSPRLGSITIRDELVHRANENASPIMRGDTCSVATAFAHKALVIRKSRNDHAKEVFERSRQMLDKLNISTIDCRYWIFYVLRLLKMRDNNAFLYVRIFLRCDFHQ